jgi:hypothetical protein
MAQGQRQVRRVHYPIGLEWLEERCLPSGHGLGLAAQVAGHGGADHSEAASSPGDGAAPNAHGAADTAHGKAKEDVNPGTQHADADSIAAPAVTHANADDANATSKGDKHDNGQGSAKTGEEKVIEIPSPAEKSHGAIGSPGANVEAVRRTEPVLSEQSARALELTVAAAQEVIPAPGGVGEEAAGVAPSATETAVASESSSERVAEQQVRQATAEGVALATDTSGELLQFLSTLSAEALTAAQSSPAPGTTREEAPGGRPLTGGGSAFDPRIAWPDDALLDEGGGREVGIWKLPDTRTLVDGSFSSGEVAPSAAPLPGPQASERLVSASVGDVGALDRALGELLAELERLGVRRDEGGAWGRVALWAVAGAAAAGAIELRRRRQALAVAEFTDGAALGWSEPGGPGA